mmetsp:Transcript_36446/g.77692  ORF Transcript_36446/g.77692 Transcript_36446/m.77692 type:complete len:770 (+) Transcript_36446:2189-4498(+)
MLARGETDSVCIHMRVTGQCTHVWKKKYDRVMGKARQEQINEIALGNGRLMPPARRAAKSLSRVDGHSFAVGNHGGLATDVETQYELSREAKKKLFKDMNLTGDMLVNVINVIEALKEKDKKRRSSRGDSSTDFLGLVHNSSFHNGLHMEIWTKEILKLVNQLRPKALILYKDGTGELLHLKGCTKPGHIIHSMISMCPLEMLLKDENFRYGRRTQEAMPIGEVIGHHQPGVTCSRFWKYFFAAADKIHGDQKNPLPNPVLLNTDNCGQYQNGWIDALRVTGQVTNRVMWNNVTLLILFWYEYQISVGRPEDNQKIARTAYTMFEKLCPSAIHACRPHVCGDGKDWVASKKRLPEVKNLGDRLRSMFAHVFNQMTSLSSIRHATTILTHAILLLQRDEIELPSFSIDSPVHEHHDEAEWNKHAKDMRAELDRAADCLYIRDTVELKELIQTEMEVNERPHCQSFSGVQQVDEATNYLKQRKAFVYAYLSSINLDNSTGIIKYHLIYDAIESDKGEFIPITSGAFQKEVELPYPGGRIANEWKCDSAAQYLKRTWLKSPALWSYAVIHLLREALQCHIYGNNCHMEGVIGNKKKQPDRALHCSEPATYLESQWESFEEKSRTFVANLERMDGIVNRRKAAAAAATMIDGKKTDDAIENESFMTEGAMWDSKQNGGHTPELRLQNSLRHLFVNKFGHSKFSVWHKFMSDWIAENGVGDLNGMGKSNFNDWMNGRRHLNTDKKIADGAVKGMKHFLEVYEEEKKEKKNDDEE